MNTLIQLLHKKNFLQKRESNFQGSSIAIEEKQKFSLLKIVFQGSNCKRVGYAKVRQKFKILQQGRQYKNTK